jgi:multiple sugar transport system permease protein
MRSKKTVDLSIPLLLAPYVTLFMFFIAFPVVLAVILSFTYFNTVQFPTFNGISNYVAIITQDEVFMKNVLPNTVIFSLIVGPIGYVLQFMLAWTLAQITKVPRTIFALVFYSPSMTVGTTIAVIWKVVFAGDQFGYLNSILLRMNIIDAPIAWLQTPEYILPVMIIVSLWSSMGVGFLAMLSGVLNVDPELYEAAYLDGVKNRFQEIIHVTVPSMRPQMLFGAIMSLVTTFSAGAIGVELTGSNPTPSNAGQTVINHINDYGFARYEMGYSAALSVVLLLMILGASKLANKFFADND